MSVASTEWEAEEELEFEEEYEGELEAEDEAEAEFLNTIAGLAQRVAGSPTFQEAEAEAEAEAEEEWEAEANPQLRAYPDALMEHLGHMAAEAESEDEAEAFIAAAIPLAAQLLPKALPLISRAAPKLIKSAGKVARVLRRNPRTRKLVSTVPGMLKRTVATVSRQSRTGRPVTTATVNRAFRQQARQVLSNPAQCAHVYRTNRTGDRQYHYTTGTPVAAPARPVRRIVRPAPVVARPATVARTRPPVVRRAPAVARVAPSQARPRQCICCGAVEYR